ncbi:MAG: AI-2E family transporter [Clostridia bacterium]|nr:AI-2E family transporter [Clostridia bacterium]
MKQLSWKTCLRAGVTVVLVYLACTYWHSVTAFIGLAIGAASPLVLGACIAYVANILMAFYERSFFVKSKKPIISKVRRPVCMLLAFVTVLLALYWLMATIIPELIYAADWLIRALPDALRQLFAWLEEEFSLSTYLADTGLVPSENFDWNGAVSSALNLLLTGVGGVMGAAVSVVSTLFSTVVTLFLAIVFAIYLMAGKERLGAQVHRVARTYLGEKTAQKVFYVLETLDASFHSFIVGQCTEAIILGCLCFLGMMVFQFHNAMTISVMVGFTALIPIAGAYFAAAVGAFMIFVESPLQALLFVIFLTILQQIEGNVIFPRVVGSSIGLPAVWVLVAVTVGGGMLGVLGMLLGVPLASALYRLLGRDMQAREKGVTVFEIPPEPKRKNTLFR